LARSTPLKTHPSDFIGEFIRIGTGPTTEYVRVEQRTQDGFLGARHSPGVMRYDHLAGEPWASFHMREWYELEGTDIWDHLSVSVAARDAAVAEQVVDILEVLFSTQEIFRDDGSFANEPGSYGWGTYEYIRLFQQISYFLGDTVKVSDDFRNRMLNALVMWNDFPFSDGVHPMLNGGGAANQLSRFFEYSSGVFVSLSLKLLREIFPERTDLISRYEKIIEQEANRRPGSYVENRSFKVDGWGYAMLRGPGPWDSRMETLLSSKKLNSNPADHVSNDALGLCLFAHGTLMTPRYGYHWIGYPAELLNRVTIDGLEAKGLEPVIWGDFLHFDDHPQLPSAIAYTEMAERRKTAPGLARQERWTIQLPEYLFDGYFVYPRDGQTHTFEWGHRNLGEVAVVLPEVSLTPAKNDDGTPWEPFGYYRQNTGHEGQEATVSQMWQADWTMNEGAITFPAEYANPPRGSKLRLTMAAAPDTKIVTAWLILLC